MCLVSTVEVVQFFRADGVRSDIYSNTFLIGISVTSLSVMTPYTPLKGTIRKESHRAVLTCQKAGAMSGVI